MKEREGRMGGTRSSGGVGKRCRNEGGRGGGRGRGRGEGFMSRYERDV